MKIIILFILFNLPHIIWGQKDTASIPLIIDSSITNKVEAAQEIDTEVINKNKFLPKLDHHKIEEKTLPNEILKEQKKDPDYWYADSVFKEKNLLRIDSNQKKSKKNIEKSSIKPIKLTALWRSILWFLMIAILVSAVLYALSMYQTSLFKNKNYTLKPTSLIQNEENILSTDFEKEIFEAENLKQYRLAIRLLYLQNLKKLHENKIIFIKQEYTNRDYLLQLTQSKFYNPFFECTRYFDFAWYGLFNLDAEKYQTIKNKMITFYQSLS